MPSSPESAISVPSARTLEVDPAISAVIVHPGAPEAMPARVALPQGVPGEVGVLAATRALFNGLRHGVAYDAAQRERHGNLYRGMYAAEPVLFVWDADEVQRIMRNEHGLWSAGMGWDALVFDKMRPQRGNFGGLLSMDFDPHRLARKLVQPAFTQKALKGYLETALGRVESTVSHWIESGRVDFKRASRGLMAGVSSEIFTGISDPAQVASIDQALSDFWHGPLALIKDARFGPSLRRAIRGLATLESELKALLPVRRAAPGKDLFSQMCQVESEGDTSDRALIYIFLTIMFAAFDTTAHGVTSMAYLLAKHPSWQERLRSEALRVMSGGITWSGLQQLEQLEWAWKETLRLMPINAGLPRRALRDFELLGHSFRAGTFVAAMAGAMGRHPNWWSDPLQFDPERFSPQRAEDKKHPAIYLPFGGGAHACVGMQLATLETKLLFYTLVTRCRFELARDYTARHTMTPVGCVSGKVALKLTRLS
ncbi:MAG: cytochrome P450 [Polyangiales bacterium]